MLRVTPDTLEIEALKLDLSARHGSWEVSRIKSHYSHGWW